ncbi:MAG: 2'-5' RNA ligase family protein [Bacteroidia bacterium]
MPEQSLYFIALIPPKEIYNHLHSLKEYIAQKYHCKQALKSPPHITLEPPFQYPPKKESFLIQKINALNTLLPHKNILVEINDYDVFLPKVVFANVLQTAELKDTYNYVHQYVKTQLGIVKDLPPRPFHPHITIAFRDVKKQQTSLILQDLKNHHPLNIRFSVQYVSLLKHDGKQWQIIL